MILQKIIITSNNVGLNDIKIKWLVKNLEKVSVGQRIVQIYAINPMSMAVTKELGVKRSEFEGILCVAIPNETPIYRSSLSDTIFGYVVDDISDIRDILNCEAQSCVDNFTGQLSVSLKHITNLETIGLPLSVNSQDALYLSCDFHDKKFYLNFYYFTLKLKKGDTFSFKFEDDCILDYTLGSRPVKILKQKNLPEDNEKCEYLRNFHSNYFGKRESLRESTFVLSKREIAIFMTKKICLGRITFNSEGGNSVDVEIRSNVWDNVFTPLIINNMFKTMVDEISKYDGMYLNVISSALTSKSYNADSIFDYCYVYLMRDEANEYYKIGMSNAPTYREGTLQSEKPSIKLIAYHKYPTRKFAAAIESALHTVYKDKRIRGEWLKLEKKDVMTIIEGLK